MTQRKAEEEQIRTQEDEVCEEEMDGKMSEDDWIDTGEEEGKSRREGIRGEISVFIRWGSVYQDPAPGYCRAETMRMAACQ